MINELNQQPELLLIILVLSFAVMIVQIFLSVIERKALKKEIEEYAVLLEESDKDYNQLKERVNAMNEACAKDLIAAQERLVIALREKQKIESYVIRLAEAIQEDSVEKILKTLKEQI